MNTLNITEIKAFVPAQDFELSKQFYQDMGFTMASDGDGIAYFHKDGCSFLLQDFYLSVHANNFMMHLLVEDVDSWYAHIMATDIVSKYQVRISEVVTQPWRMRDFCLTDPGGVLWRIGENIQ